MSSGQEVPKTASLSLTVLMVQYYCAYSSVRKFNDMDQTRSYTSYCTVALEKKKKKKKKERPGKGKEKQKCKMEM